jgi:hypothetical protein
VFKFTLDESPQGTGKAAVVLRRAGAFGNTGPGSHAEFPVLAVDCYADPSRDPDGDFTTQDATDRAYALYRVVNAVLHGQRGVWWGAGGNDLGLQVISSDRMGEPFHSRQEDLFGYAATLLPLGDMTRVTAQYAVHTAH